MVATRGTEEVVKFVTGKERIPLSEISPVAWADIVRSELEALPVNYLRGFKGIAEILQYKPTFSGGIARTVPEDVHRFCGGADGIALNRNAVFLNCAQRASPEFPSKWHEAPRNQGPGRNGRPLSGLARITGEYLLLSRHKKFYLLHAEWVAKERWEKQSMASSPYDFWYNLDAQSRKYVLNIREVSDVDLVRWLAPRVTDQHPPIPIKVLLSFSIALSETGSALRHQFEYVLACENDRLKTLARVGFAV